MHPKDLHLADNLVIYVNISLNTKISLNILITIVVNNGNPVVYGNSGDRYLCSSLYLDFSKWEQNKPRKFLYLKIGNF